MNFCDNLKLRLLFVSLCTTIISCNKVEPVEELNEPEFYINLQHSGTTEDLRSVCFVNKDTGLIVGKRGGLYKTIDGGIEWRKYTPVENMSEDTFVTYNKIHFVNQTTGWIVGTHSTSRGGGHHETLTAHKTIILKSIDGGNTWLDKDFDIRFVKSFMSMDFLDNIGYVVGEEGFIYKTIDRGENWVKQQSGTTERIRDIAIFNANIAMAIGYSGLILKTTDGGNSWVRSIPPSSRAFHKIRVVNENLAYLTGGGEGNGQKPNPDKAFVYSIDANGNFKDLTNQRYSVFYNLGLYASPDGQTVWTASDLGQIFQSTNGGKTWSFELTKSKRQETLNDISFPTDRVGYFVGEKGVILKVDLDRD